MFKLVYEPYTNINDIIEKGEVIHKRKCDYINLPMAFDIETSSHYKGKEKRANMYAWVLGINGKCFLGREWEDFINAINYLSFVYKTNIKRRIIIYVHNLSYEFQFIKHRFEWENVFSLDTRKPCYAVTKSGIEFRCSLILTNYSLEIVGRNLLKYKVDKKVGDLDYSLIRHSRTPLTDKEIGYIINDCLVVMAHIQEEIERQGNITKIPLTKTAYVRNLCADLCLRSSYKFEYSKLMKQLTLTPEQYMQLKRTYMGGFTHANYNYVDITVIDVYSFDFTSSYPAVMLSEKYPMSKPIEKDIDNEKDFQHYLDHFCCMFDVTFYNIESSVDFEHYISTSRCLECENEITDNGRIIKADKVTVSLTELDYKIIEKMYNWEYKEVFNFNYFIKDYLPKPIIEMILELYEDKTTLKGVVGKEAEYLSSKEKINSMYGMCVTDPCRDEQIYDNEKGWSTHKINIEEAINKYNNSNTRCLYYPWGVWVTAYARYNLFTGILEFREDYIYSDTDSIKVFNKDNHKEYFEKYNEDVKNKIKKCLKHYSLYYKRAEPKTINGVCKPLGVWDYEGKYNRFKTLGAKRYITEVDEIEITIAGVSKKAGKKYLLETFKNNDRIFKNFTDHLYFPAEYVCNGVVSNGSGKMCHTYIDYYISDYIIDYLGEEYIFNEYSSVHLENTDYTMDISKEFWRLLLGRKGGHII